MCPSRQNAIHWLPGGSLFCIRGFLDPPPEAQMRFSSAFEPLVGDPLNPQCKPGKQWVLLIFHKRSFSTPATLLKIDAKKYNNLNFVCSFAALVAPQSLCSSIWWKNLSKLFNEIKSEYMVLEHFDANEIPYGRAERLGVPQLQTKFNRNYL